MKDEIRISGLDVFAHHGVFPQENTLGQHFIVNATLYTQTHDAGLTDDLTQTTNYGEVCHAITDFLQSNNWKLIETVAEQTAKMLLTTFPLIGGVTLEIEKPQAPIGLPLRTVSVCIHRQWHRAFVALGSNLGDRRTLIQTALEEMKANPLIRLLKCSTLIETKPYGGVEQSDFLNGVVSIETLLTPFELLDELHRLEQQANRIRTVHWGPRTLDLDILLYEDKIIDTETLRIPHVDMQNRDFVLIPMEEIAPYAMHPILHKSMLQLRNELEGRG